MEPKLVFDYFAEINKVPRPSKHEEKIIAWLEQFATEKGIDCKKDEAGNILYSVPATPGMEQKPTVIFQAHMDMVCEKTADCKIDFMNDPIETYIDSEQWMRAKGTTLGADDGLGIAMALAFITDPSVEHGPLQCLFTVDEETGLTGAFALQPGFMNGQYLINLDSEDEGQIFIGCAGGANTTIGVPTPLVALSKKYFPVRIVVDGLRGGHSGDDINKHRLNANKALVRFLDEVQHKYDLQLIDIQAGGLHNAIPRHAEAVIAVPFPDKENLRVDFNIFSSELEAEYEDEANMRLTMESEPAELCIEPEIAKKLISALLCVHNGVYEMSVDLPGLVETSSNLASIRLIKDASNPAGSIVQIVTSQRSSIGSQRKAMSAIVRAPFELIGGKCETGEGYPGWKPNPDSHLLKVAIDEYKKMFNKEPEVKAIHAGLECGLFSEKYPGLDMISVGPTLRGVHSPDERLYTPTVKMVYDHIVAILKSI